MRVAMTGATGVIGRRVIPALLAAGHEVTAMTRAGSDRRPVLPPGCRTSDADLFDVDALTAAFAGHEAVINLATRIPGSAIAMMLPWSWRENDRLRSAGARNVAEAARRIGAETLIQESFAFAYPSCGDAWIKESVALAPAGNTRTVVDAEAAASGFAASGGRGVVLRFAGFYGPDADQTRTMALAVRKGWAPLPGKRSSYISSISHDDAAAAVVAALAAPSGAYNVSDDEPLTRGDFFAAIARALDVGPPHFLPEWTARLMGVVGPSLVRSIRLDNRKLRDATGWRPSSRSAADGLPAAIAAALAE